jgi:tRNA(fMet)-specific endonuclease VapC
MRGHGDVNEHLRARQPFEVCISALTLAELRSGADQRNSARIHRAIDVIVRQLYVAPFDAAAATRYGKVAALAKARTPVANFDMLIAAHALSLGVRLVTNNTKDFVRVKGLRIETWV